MITVTFDAYSHYQTDSVYQWDKDRTFEIVGLELPSTPKIHFTNKLLGGAIPKDVEAYGSIYRVKIPNSLLQYTCDITAYVVVDGKTVEEIVIPVKQRPRPIGYEISVDDDEIYTFDSVKEHVDKAIETMKQLLQTNPAMTEALEELEKIDS